MKFPPDWQRLPPHFPEWWGCPAGLTRVEYEMRERRLAQSAANVVAPSDWWNAMLNSHPAWQHSANARNA